MYVLYMANIIDLRRASASEAGNFLGEPMCQGIQMSQVSIQVDQFKIKETRCSKCAIQERKPRQVNVIKKLLIRVGVIQVF